MSNNIDPALDIPSNFHEEDELKVLQDSDDVDKLRSILQKDETVHRLVLGYHDESDGVLAATSKRILFVDRKFISSLVVSFAYDDIAAIVYNTELTMTRITLAHSNGALTVEKVDRDHGDRFITYVRNLIGGNYKAIGKNKRAMLHNDDVIRLQDLYSQENEEL